MLDTNAGLKNNIIQNEIFLCVCLCVCQRWKSAIWPASPREHRTGVTCVTGVACWAQILQGLGWGTYKSSNCATCTLLIELSLWEMCVCVLTMVAALSAGSRAMHSVEINHLS